jgi:hypothetical protein
MELRRAMGVDYSSVLIGTRGDDPAGASNVVHSFTRVIPHSGQVVAKFARTSGCMGQE